MSVQFGVLGTLEVWSDGATVPVRGAKRRGVLAYLLVHAGEPQPLDRIVDALWGEDASPSSAATVKTYVSQLRKRFGSDSPSLVHRAGGYVLGLNPEALDASRFEAAIAAASAVAGRDRRLDLLDEALRLWRGTPLGEFAGLAWADERARQWSRMYVLGHQLRAAALLDAGRQRDALPALEQLVSEYPLHEPFWAQLIVARYRCGQQTDALAAASEARKVLATELGLEPGPELVELERQVLAHDPSLDGPRAERRYGARGHVATVVEPLPDGVVTFLLTDIEGSTALWDRHPEEMAKALVRHEDVIADVVHMHDGRLLKSRGEGDATLSVFAKATDAAEAGVALQRRLRNEPWPGGLDLPTRVALHAGEAQLRNGDYFGGTLNRAARVRGLAAGGQVLVSRAVHDLVIDVLASDLQLVGLGEHAMKGLQRRENVYAMHGPGLDARIPTPGERGSEQLDDGLIESGESIRDSAGVVPDAHVAPSRSSLIGRIDAIGRIGDALAQPGLVTLVGPGGIGKTRLLEEAHVRFGDRFERVWRVDLGAARDRASVESALEEAILPARDPMGPSTDIVPTRELLTEIASQLTGRRVLVALDNCEQLIDFLPDIIEAFVARAPSLTVLATSREPLAARGEIVIRVSPLAVPAEDAFTDPSGLLQVESVELLVARARERGSDLTVSVETAEHVASICRQLDGIPLAIELAAARLASTSLRDLAARLPRQLELLVTRRGDPRHRTLRNAIGWSFELLEPAQQLLLRRLGIFMGGFTLAAAEAVCPASNDDTFFSPDAVYLDLAELVAKSLVVFDRERNRYRLLEPIRQFARHLLEDSDELNALADRHAGWAFGRARESLLAFLSGDGRAADQLRDDLDNLHAALDWLRDRDHNTFLRMVANLGYAWSQTDWRRGRAVAEVAVRLAEEVPDRLRAGVLLARGMVEQRDDLARSSEWLAEARDIYVRINDAQAVALATFLLARSNLWLRPDEARALFIDAAERFRELHVGTGETWALINLGDDAQNYGRFVEARAFQERALAVARESQATGLLGTLLAVWAMTTAALGDLQTARREMREAIDTQLSYGDTWNLIGTLSEAAWLDVLARDYESADALLRLALRKGLELDDPWQLRESLLILGVVRLRQNNHRAARELFAATGWDTQPPEGILRRVEAVSSRAFRELETLDNEYDDDAALEGRNLGVFGAARKALR